MKSIILNEKLQKIARINFLRDFPKQQIKIYKNTQDINENNKQLSNGLDYNIAVFSPTENLEDFYITFLNKKLLKSIPYNLDDIKGLSVFNSFLDFNKNNNVLSILREIYRTNQSQRVYIECYEGNILFKRLNVNIIKIDNLIYLLGKDETDYTLFMKKDKFFETYTEAIAIIQNEQIVQCNKEYLKLHDNKKYDEIIGTKIEDILINNTLTDVINENIINILEQKKYSYALPIKIKENNKIEKYFNLNFNYTLFDNKPAVMIIYNNITKQQLNNNKIENLNESQHLKQIIQKIQKINKTATIYKIDNKVYGTNSIFNLLKIDPKEYSDYNEYFSKFVLDKDLNYLKEAYEKCNPSHPEETCIIRVKNNIDKIIYIKCHIVYEYDSKGNENNCIIYYEDITNKVKKEKELKKVTEQLDNLKNNIKKIQHASKFSIFYNDLVNNKNMWYNEGYNVFDLDPSEYRSNMRQYVIKKDLNLLKEKHTLCTPKNPETTFVTRVYSAGKLRYVKTFLRYDFDENGNKKSYINLIQDITDIATQSEEFKESLDEVIMLRKSLNILQQINKTSLGYSTNLKDIVWTPEIFNILEVDPNDYQNKKSNILNEFVIKDDLKIRKKAIEKISPTNPDTTFIQRIKTGKGNIKYIKTTIHYNYDPNGNYINCIGFDEDVTDEMIHQKQLENALKETTKLNDNLNRIQNASKTFISFSYNLQNIQWTSEVYNILEIDPEEYENKENNIIEDFIIEEDKKIRTTAISHISPINPDITFIQRVKTGKGNIKYIKSVIHYEYNENNRFIKRIGFNQDITNEITYEEELEKALNKNKLLLKEVHHRVKNNLQIILSLINLNNDFNSSIEETLLNTENHLYAMALIHEKIYGSKSISEVNMKEYIDSLVSAIFDLYNSNIKFHSNIESINLQMEQAIPLGLIINEIVTNTIKYAFPDKKEGNLYIKLKKEKTHYTLIFQDDGIGLPDDIDLDNPTSLGLIVITNLTLQIEGTISLLDCNGTGYKMEFDTK